MDRSIYSLETSIVVQYNVKNNSHTKLGVNIIRMIIKSLNELIKLEYKRELNPEYSRRRREIVLHKQSLLLDRYKSELESILMNIEDSHNRNLIYEYYRLNVLNNIMKSLYNIEFKLVGKPEKLKLSIHGFGKTLVNSLHKVTYKNEILKCNELCWRFMTIMNNLISSNFLPVEIIKYFDILNNIDIVLFYKYNDNHERHYYLVLVTLLQLIELILLRRNNSSSSNEEVIANELKCFNIILKDIPKYIALSLKLAKLNISTNYSESIILLHLGIKALKAYFINNNNIYIVWDAVDYEAYHLLSDLHYWNRCVLSNRTRNYDMSTDVMIDIVLDFNDIAIGSTLVSDMLYCTSTLLLQLLNQMYNNFNENDGFNNCNKMNQFVHFEYDVHPLIPEVLISDLKLIHMSLDGHIVYYGYSESTLAKPKIMVDESGAIKMKFWHDIQCKLKVIDLLHIDYVLMSHIDDEIISMFRYISASFTTGIMYKNAFYSIMKGFQLCLLRKLNYFIQISWLEAILSFILCYIKNGVVEGESNINGSVRRDILLYFHELIPMIIEIMNYQHLALSIQRIGLLIIRLLIKEPFMTKTDIDDLIGKPDEEEVDDKTTKVVKKNAIVDSDRLSIHSDEDDEEEEPDNVIDEKKKTLKGKFYEWYLKTINKKIEENDIFPTPCFNLVETIVFVGETHIQSSDVLEQLLLLIYQLGVYSNLAKLSMVENGVRRIVQRILDMQSKGEVYVTTLAAMCLEVVYVD